MKLPHFFRIIRNSTITLSLIFFLAALMSCILLVDKETVNEILGKEEVANLSITPGKNELQLTWTNPKALNAEKIEIWYGTGYPLYKTRTIQITGNTRGKIATEKFSNLHSYYEYTFKLIVVYADGSTSNGTVISGCPNAY